MSFKSLALDLMWHRRLERAPGLFDPRRVQKILVVRNDNIGDVLCTTPALDALRQAFPQAHIAALVCTLTRDAIEGHPALDALYVYPKAKHKVHGPVRSHLILARLLSRLKKERFDLAVCFRSNFSSSQAWLAYASGARWRLGPRAEGKRAGMGFFYNLPCDPPPNDMHEVRRCFHLLGQIGVDTEPKSLYLKVPGPAKESARKLLIEHGLDLSSPPVVINMTRCAYSQERNWLDRRWKRLVRELMRKGLPLVVTCAPGDHDWARGILAGLESAPPVFCSQSLKEFGAVVGMARPFVTVEGGTMHIASAMGAPQVVMWSYTSLDNWRPWSGDALVLESGGDVRRIEVDRVMEAVTGLLAHDCKLEKSGS